MAAECEVPVRSDRHLTLGMLTNPHAASGQLPEAWAWDYLM